VHISARHKVLIIGLVCLLCACGVGVLASSFRPSVASPVIVIQTVPLYPGALNVTRTNTLPGIQGVYDAAARVSFDTSDTPKQVQRFYDDWATHNAWSFRGTAPTDFLNEYEKGQRVTNFRLTPDGGPLFNTPWFDTQTHRFADYHLVVQSAPNNNRTTSGSFTLYRLQKK
jgi:hypothetical protein